MKSCSKCNIVKELSEFHRRKSSSDGRKSSCSLCDKKYRDDNKEKLSKYFKERRDLKKDELKLKSTEYYILNKEYIKSKSSEYYKNNRDTKLEYQKEYQKKNKEKRNSYFVNRRKNDPLFKLITNIRNLIYNSFYYNGYSKNSKTENLLGCTFDEFKIYLESKFEEWMTWENRGLYNNDFNFGWDIDHIIPLSSASNKEDIIRLNHYTNLQPLCSKINRDIKKNNLEYGII
jgi:hypothetical protein